MSQLIPLAQSPNSSRVSHLLPTVKCSNCTQPVPLSSLTQHVCSPQQQPVLPKQQYVPPQQQHVPPQQPRLRSDSQSLLRLRPSISKPPVINTVSHVPFPTISTPPPRQEDYMPGGESGMAGVGRRAFQAAAHAAVFAQNYHHHQQQHYYPGHPEQPIGIQGRRPNMPHFLDIVGASGRGTPPLSPNSTHSSPRSHSPLSPFPHSPVNTNVASAIAASRTPSPALHAPISPARSMSSSSHSSGQRDVPTPTSASFRLPFFQKYKDTLTLTPPLSPGPSPKDQTFNTTRPDSIPPSSPTESEYSGGGLAYDRDDSGGEEEDAVVGKLSLEKDRASTSSRSAYSAASVRFTRDDMPPPSPRRSHTTPTVGPRGGPGGVPSPLGSASPPGAGAARSASDAKNIRRGKENETVSKTRVCVRCEQTIDSGRWIRTDSDKGVLCERCWKNMYLPKCRRCEKPIEQAAVFSSDGQLKGKYHRDCFTCATCHEPFPDKSFYVYDGHPMCEFHYHEANHSLCASPTCGRPIEGPCAITYIGDKYHPDCLRCGHVGCDECLEDYWEVDGMMLCERHAQRHEQDIDDVEEAEENENDHIRELARIPSVMRPGRLGSSETRAQKRKTRLINLTGMGLGF